MSHLLSSSHLLFELLDSGSFLRQSLVEGAGLRQERVLNTFGTRQLKHLQGNYFKIACVKFLFSAARHVTVTSFMYRHVTLMVSSSSLKLSISARAS